MSEITRLRLPEKFPFAYETHLHTSEASACARSTGAEMARACKEAGYTGIFVTDHFVGGNTAVDRSLPWTEWVERFCLGYEHAKAEGDRIGLQVFFGFESGYHATEFLIYGLSKEWLLTHPEIRDCTIEEQYGLVHEGGGMVIHAHPFREEGYIPAIRLFPDYEDGAETVNATHVCTLSKSHNNPVFDDQAKVYARAHNFPVTAGSDVHSTRLLFGGMAFGRRMEEPQDFIHAVMSKEPCLLLSGNETALGEDFTEAYV
ncbi:MAG: PHP domain-containing protein [Lachnospiraceae bacterium]|nr:PHP domain-containing protein [Lachnospiraceae bacterium]